MRLAILIVGEQNSGKTSTIKHLIELYNGRILKNARASWKSIFLNSLLGSLKLIFYCIPASPTETKIKLSARFATWTFLPEVLVIAEQSGGTNYPDTINFLALNGYNVLRYDILKTSGPADWERFNSGNVKTKLDNRANEIVDDIKNFIKSNGII
jgi:hypothetical protein